MKIWNGPSPTYLEKALFVAPQIRGVVSIMAHLGHLQAMGGDGSGTCSCSNPYCSIVAITVRGGVGSTDSVCNV